MAGVPNGTIGYRRGPDGMGWEHIDEPTEGMDVFTKL